MSNEKVSVLNLETGEHGWIRRKWFESSALNKGILVEVDPDQKSYVPELWKSKVDEDSDTTDTDPDEGEDE